MYLILQINLISVEKLINIIWVFGFVFWQPNIHIKTHFSTNHAAYFIFFNLEYICDRRGTKKKKKKNPFKILFCFDIQTSNDYTGFNIKC